MTSPRSPYRPLFLRHPHHHHLHSIHGGARACHTRDTAAAARAGPPHLASNPAAAPSPRHDHPYRP